MSEETALAVQRELTPNILRMFQELDTAAYKSRRFGVTEGETVIKLLFCYENGLALSVANTGLYVVNGKMQIEGHVVAAQFKRHPDYDYTIEGHNEKGCTIVVWREWEKGEQPEKVGEARFDETHAKRAGLLGKDNFKKYPEDMYFNKALARAFRRFAPDLFTQSVYLPGELPGSDDSVTTTWEVVDSEETEVAKVITLDDLLKEYDAEEVLVANEGRVPATNEEVAAVAERLGA